MSPAAICRFQPDHGRVNGRFSLPARGGIDELLIARAFCLSLLLSATWLEGADGPGLRPTVRIYDYAGYFGHCPGQGRTGDLEDVPAVRPGNPMDGMRRVQGTGHEIPELRAANSGTGGFYQYPPRSPHPLPARAGLLALPKSIDHHQFFPVEIHLTP